MLEIRDLTVRYGRIAAVQGASLHVGEGELVGLVGPNGAGKSSTLKAVAGLVGAADGEVLVAGEPVGSSPIRAGIAYVPESRRIFGGLTVEENLRLGATTRGRSDRSAELRRMYERFPLLGTRRRSGAGDLSGGQQQILAIARALVARPRLLLLDEPTLGLSPAMIDEVFGIVASLREDGVTVLLVEQNTLRTLALADRTYVMRPPGQIVFEGSQAELERDPTVEQRYLQLL
ncbi:MAG TPA: ABC transporter ATP-binding protein [Thermoleophilaceae bacterium]|nr:ABC transporter ATP-binding protein [Thermoleophilaceae bacterium]